MKRGLLLLYLFLVALIITAQVTAFPGAEGAGAYASGGRGGDVYHVTNLNNSGAGSLREGINTTPEEGRTIVFDVSGDIYLTKSLNINKPNLTIAGQTAPGKGICIRDYRTNIDASNIIIRHLRFRPEEVGGDGDALSIKSGKNIIIDHCSVSWSSDEVLSTSGNAIDSLTVQWCYIYEGRNISYHYENGILIDHSMGSLLSSTIDSAKFTFHHNLYAHNRTRNPKITTENDNSTIFFDFYNNVIYDWGSKAGYSSDKPTHHVRMNYIGNYLIAGPDTDNGCKNEAFEGMISDTWIYQSGNKIDSDKDTDFDGVDTEWSMFSGPFTKVYNKFDIAFMNEESADLALVHVLNFGGACPWNRDSADKRITNDVYNQTGGIIDSPTETGGYIVLPTQSSTTIDTDNDGMPDEWENEKGLNSTNPADANLDRNTDGYTNLEEYLNHVALQLENSTLVLQPEISKPCLFPIPCKNNLTLKLESKKDQTIDIAVLGIAGNKVLSFPSQQLFIGTNELQLPISLPKGSYLLQLSNDSRLTTLFIAN
jgi:pectate lyase